MFEFDVFPRLTQPSDISCHRAHMWAQALHRSDSRCKQVVINEFCNLAAPVAEHNHYNHLGRSGRAIRIRSVFAYSVSRCFCMCNPEERILLSLRREEIKRIGIFIENRPFVINGPLLTRGK